MPTAQLNGITINYEIDGPDTAGETVVLVNGLADDLQSWGFQIPALADAGFRVLRFDNRGIGKTRDRRGPTPPSCSRPTPRRSSTISVSRTSISWACRWAA